MAAEAAGGKYRSTVSKSKDPSGLLISVIRTLSTSDDVEDRENEKGRLEEAYEKCDRDLDELIVQHYTELTTAIRTYQSITERITNSRNKIKQVKENLLSCKMLLHCKRDELRKLWIEGIEHKHVLNLLDEIENIKQVPQKLEQCMATKHYLSATDMLPVTHCPGDARALSVKEINLQEIKEDLELDPEENSALFMGILIKGLAKLKKIPETVKAIKERLEQELKQIVKRSTTQVADSGYQRGENLTGENQPRLLLELLELLFDKFNAVAAAHSVVLGYLQQTVSPSLTQQEEVKLYDMADVWVKIQDVLQMLLTEYLDMKNTRTASEPSAQLSYASTGREFAAFFAKKKPQRPKNSLFKFESSSHAISMSAYLREQRRELYSRSGELQGGPDDNLIEGGGTKFVCKPGARNITVIFHPLLRFIQEIEHALGLGPAKQCPLREFLTVYIKNIFLNQVLAEINKEIEGVTKTSDPLKILANADTMKVLGVQRPLLQSTIIVEKTVQDLTNLMHDLSAYSDQFLNMVCGKLQEYKDTCTAAYRGIVQSEEKLVISASWAKDDDISRLLKSLPNWINMAQPRQLRPKREEEEDSLSPGQESHANMDLPPVSEQILQTLSELAKSFQDMADRCLLVLHLEVRVHCFHYLIPLAKEGNYAIVANVESMDYDPLVVKLNKDISAIEEAMSASLQQHKFQYIFEGLGHLISCILINGAQYFRRISESGIKKMCRNIFVLQQNLTNITMSREADLDFARQYYEMLYNTADELLNLVVDQGVKYTELEYIHALTLLHRSQTGVGDQTTQNMRLQRLKEIICEQAAIKQATKDKKITTV
ncbi:exocyst complex component 4 [Orycteropus afer afer]|uniref:Exocyst complex component Sec8 n=1 Tax=Orycteropus afer afer TaxID=1230840 RepID=A0A8B7AT03_ORYAF|nr:exocyst complex component 4 [Orycteropus afer afer]